MIETERLKLIPFTRQHYEVILKNDNVSLGKLLEVETPESWSVDKNAKEAIPALIGFAVMAVLCWLIGRACRYVLSGI